MDRIEELLREYREEMVETVRKWVAIPSVKGEAAPGAPFGENARKALDAAMADCERCGLKTEVLFLLGFPSLSFSLVMVRNFTSFKIFSCQPGLS